ncbi:MAG: helix-turn-helix transcriptional regulator [Burkholderiales bacterium]|nr:helix-turn-helix transcriptional regulator [Burkholderiales bacterium]
MTPSARVTLRQLCNLDLPAPVLLPSLLPAIRNVVPATHAAFFYVDANGNMVNMYAERMLPPEAMARYYERHYRSDSSAFSRAWARLLASHDPVSSRTVTAAEKAGDYYRDVLSQLDVEHIMYGVIRAPGNGRAPIGQLSLYRPTSDRPFTPTDADALRDVLHYLGEALKPAPYVPAAALAEQTAEEAMAVLDDDGNTLFADDGWLRLVRLARGEPITPSQASVEPRALREFLRGVALAASAARNAVHIVDSAWGRFAFRHHLLAGAAGDHATALVVSRLAAEQVRLTEGAARLQLSAQQREVALMIALGQTNAEIAEKLNVSVNTAGYHVKQVFAKLDVHDRSEVAAVLRRA